MFPIAFLLQTHTVTLALEYIAVEVRAKTD